MKKAIKMMLAFVAALVCGGAWAQKSISINFCQNDNNGSVASDQTTVLGVIPTAAWNNTATARNGANTAVTSATSGGGEVTNLKVYNGSSSESDSTKSVRFGVQGMNNIWYDQTSGTTLGGTFLHHTLCHRAGTNNEANIYVSNSGEDFEKYDVVIYLTATDSTGYTTPTSFSAISVNDVWYKGDAEESSDTKTVTCEANDTWGTIPVTGENGGTLGVNAIRVNGLSGTLHIKKAGQYDCGIAAVQIVESGADVDTGLGVISMNFNARDSDQLVDTTSSETVGLQDGVPGTSWNNQTSRKSGAFTETLNNAQIWTGSKVSSSDVSITYSANNNYHNTSRTDVFLRGYLDDGGNRANITVSNIPFKLYSVIVYCGTDTGTYFSPVKINGIPYRWGNDGIEVAGSADATTTTRWGTGNTATAQMGVNVLKLEGVAGSTLTIVGGNNANSARGSIAAFQIIEQKVEEAEVDCENNYAISTANQLSANLVTLNVVAGNTLIVDEAISKPLMIKSEGDVVISSDNYTITESDFVKLNSENVSGTVKLNFDPSWGFKTSNNATYIAGAGSADSANTRKGITFDGGALMLAGNDVTYYIKDNQWGDKSSTVNLNGASYNYGTGTLGVGTATYNISDATITAGKLVTVQGGASRTSVVNISGNTSITLSSDGDATSTGAALLMGHYGSGSSTLTMTGGTIDASNGGFRIGWDSSATVTLGGGETTATIKAKRVKMGYERTNNSTLTLKSNGVLEVGVNGMYINNGTLAMNGGTIKAAANASLEIPGTLALSETSTIDSNGHDVMLTTSGTISGEGAIAKAGEGTLKLASSTRPKIASITGGSIQVVATTAEVVANRLELPTVMSEVPAASTITVVNGAGENLDLAANPYSISEGVLTISLAGEGPINTSGNSSELFAGRSGNVPVLGGATADAAIAINFDSLPSEVTAITVDGFVKVTGNAFPSGDGKINFAEGGALIFDGTGTAQDVTTHLWVEAPGKVITKGTVTFSKITFEPNVTLDVLSGTTTITAGKKYNENANDRGLTGTVYVRADAELVLNSTDLINYSENNTIYVYGTLTLGAKRQSINGGTKLYALGSGTITGAGDGRGALHFFDSNRLVVSGTKTISAAIQMRDSSHELTIAQFRTSNVTFSGVFNGNGKLKREGATSAEGNSAGNCGNSYVYLSGANTFGGTLTNNGGFMVLMPGVAFSATTTITSAANTELDFGTENASGTVTLSNGITNSGNAMKIFADTTLSGTVSSTNGYAIQANGGTLHWAGTFTGAVANAGKLTIPQDVTFDTASNTLSGSGKIGGAGTLKSTTIPTVSVDTDWTGVVELAAIDYGSTKTGYNLSGLVRDGSTLKLHGIVGNDIYFTNANKVNGTVELVDGAVLKFNNGSSDWKLAFGEITGTGTLRTTMDAPSGKPSGITVTIDKLSSKSVTLTSNNNALITVSNLVVEESYGTPLIPLSNCSAVTVSAVNGVAKETMQTADGIYLVAAKKGGVKYKTLQAAIDAGDDISDVVVYDVGATLPSGFALVRPTESGDVKLRKAGEIYWKGGDWKADTTYYASSAKNSTTTYLTGDTVVFDTDTTVYYMQSWSEVVSAKIAENTMVIFGHNDWNGDTTRNIMSGSTITVAEGGRALFGFWDNKNNKGVPKIADLTINGAGTWGQANNLKDGVRANPGSLTISGTVTGTAKLVINEGDEVKVLSTGSVANNIVSGVDGKAVKVTTDAQSTKTYSLVGASPDAPITPGEGEIVVPVVPEAGIAIEPGADVKVPTGTDASKIEVVYNGVELSKAVEGESGHPKYVEVSINETTGAVELTTTDSAKPADTAIAMAAPTEEGSDKVQFTITNPIPGLFYAVSSCDEPNGTFTSATGSGDQATTSAEAKTVSIPMEFTGGKKVKYYKVSVKATK